MPWYWTDDVADFLRVKGTLEEEAASQMAATPVALRRSELTIEAAAEALLEDDEIPLAA